MASDVGRQIYRLRTLCLVRAACALETDPFVVESAYSKHHRQPLVARAVEDPAVGKILLALEAVAVFVVAFAY